MKNRALIALCVAAMMWAGTASTLANEGPLAVVTDTLVVRPACLVVTVFGSLFFVVSLPVAATSKTIKKTANTLIVSPAQATFTRPLGDLDSLQGY
jgi:hypothetical protein